MLSASLIGEFTATESSAFSVREDNFDSQYRIHKKKKFKKLKFIVKVKQRAYIGVFKSAEFHKRPLFSAQTITLLCFGLFFDQGKLKSANSSGLNFRKYMPLQSIVFMNEY